MSTKISRRALAKRSLIAGLSGATVACSRERPAFTTNSPPPHHTFNLVCSGMMAFFSHKRAGTLEILIPNPVMGNKTVHLVRFGRFGGETLPGGNYNLVLDKALDPAFEPGDYYRPTNNSEFSLPPYNKTIQSNDPTTYFQPTAASGTSADIFCRITLPWPNNVYNGLRPIKKKNGESGKPMYGADAKKVFGVDPDGMPGFYAFQYKYKAKVTLSGMTNDQQAYIRSFDPETPSLNLHVYSELPYGRCHSDHMKLFNAMISRADATPLNLNRQMGTTAATDVPAPPTQPIGDLAIADVESLQELGITGGLPGEVCPEATEPADCVAGWAYGS